MNLPEWQAFSIGCGNRTQPPLERRPANALVIEVGAPHARCLIQPPDGRGVTRDGGTMDWLRSGGSVLSYGWCAQSSCPRFDEMGAQGLVVAD